MLILTADEMRTADRLTVERGAASSLDLMEHAGAAVAGFVQREFPGYRHITVLCGGGNNGGDGFVAARRLHEAGAMVQVLLLVQPQELKGDAAVMFHRLPRVLLTGTVVAAQESALELPAISGLIESTELFLDAVVGTGFKPPLRGVAAALGAKLDAHSAPVIAVDLPSGWDADSRAAASPGAYRANAVVTFTAPKLAHLFGNLTSNHIGPTVAGPIVVAPIGSPDEAVKSDTGLHWCGSAAAITRAPRPPDSNKGMYGHVLVIGGSVGKSGAPSMTSLAALRAGAGLVTAAVPASILPLVAATALELMTMPLGEAGHGVIAKSNLAEPRFSAMTKRKTVIALGTGISGDPEAVEFVHGVVMQTNQPLVLDADGLNAFKGRAGELDGSHRTLVLTPHPGEMATLLGTTVKEVQANREDIAREFAVTHHLTLVLKGWRTLVAHPDGRIAVNSTGNPGMAKAGSGDILTGIIAALLGQYHDRVAEAVEAAVYLHGLAADFAVREGDQHTLLATDTLAHLRDAFGFRPQQKGLYTWIQGMPMNAAPADGMSVQGVRTREMAAPEMSKRIMEPGQQQAQQEAAQQPGPGQQQQAVAI
ncbi:MAG TPA: NAD(P)H-hydrate dehydratase [Acidisarcina sp.]